MLPLMSVSTYCAFVCLSEVTHVFLLLPTHEEKMHYAESIDLLC